MKKELNPAIVWTVIGVVVVGVALFIIFGALKPQIGKGPEVEAKPWRPTGYAGVPQGQNSPQGQSNPQGGTAPAPYGGPGGPMGAPSAPPSGTK